MKKIVLLIISIFLFANEPKVINVKVDRTNNSYNFHVTIKHNDLSNEHYVNRWEIVDEKGNILAIRILFHPHIKEQPFTRSLYKIDLPSNMKKVYIRAHDIVHGYSKKYEVILP